MSIRSNEESNRKGENLKRVIYEREDEMGDKPLIIVGGFNGHVGLVETQQVDIAWKVVVNLMTERSQILITGEKCEGEYTCARNHLNIAIHVDFVLVNAPMYNKFRKMRIDEEKKVHVTYLTPA